MSKNIKISDSVHHMGKNMAYREGTLLNKFVEDAIIAYCKTFPESKDIVVQYSKAPTEKAGKKQKWKISSFEAQVAGRFDLPDFFEDKPERKIKILAHLEGYHYYGDNNDTVMLIQFAGEEQAMPAERMQELSYLHGLPATLEVTNDYRPVNETAQMVMALAPGRTKFSKNILHVFNSQFDFNVTFADNS